MLFVCRQPTDPKKSARLKRFYCRLKKKKKIFPKFSFWFVPCFSKVPVSGIFGILVVFP
jgi:hypothetical protein